MKFSDFSGFTWLHFGITLVSLDYTLVSLWYHFGITGITLVSLWYHFGITLVSLGNVKNHHEKTEIEKKYYTFRKCPTTLRVLPKCDGLTPAQTLSAGLCTRTLTCTSPGFILQLLSRMRCRQHPRIVLRGLTGKHKSHKKSGGGPAGHGFWGGSETRALRAIIARRGWKL